MAGQLGFPKLLCRDANEDEKKCGRNDPDEDEAADANDELFEVRDMEDTIVHEQDAELGPCHMPDVDDLGDEKVLLDDGDVLGTNGGGMVASALGIHGKGDGYDDPVPDLFRLAMSSSWHATRVVEASRSVRLRDVSYHGEHDHVIVPPQRLRPYATTDKAHRNGDKSEKAHDAGNAERPNSHLPWREIRNARHVGLVELRPVHNVDEYAPFLVQVYQFAVLFIFFALPSTMMC